eukprot:317345-Pyramimonas_sp.AAC.1
MEPRMNPIDFPWKRWMSYGSYRVPRESYVYPEGPDAPPSRKPMELGKNPTGVPMNPLEVPRKCQVPAQFQQKTLGFPTAPDELAGPRKYGATQSLRCVGRATACIGETLAARGLHARGARPAQSQPGRCAPFADAHFARRRAIPSQRLRLWATCGPPLAINGALRGRRDLFGRCRCRPKQSRRRLLRPARGASTRRARALQCLPDAAIARRKQSGRDALDIYPREADETGQNIGARERSWHARDMKTRGGGSRAIGELGHERRATANRPTGRAGVSA